MRHRARWGAEALITKGRKDTVRVTPRGRLSLTPFANGYLLSKDDRQAHSTHPRGGARWPLVEAQADEVVGERPEGPCADRT